LTRRAEAECGRQFDQVLLFPLENVSDALRDREHADRLAERHLFAIPPDPLRRARQVETEQSLQGVDADISFVSLCFLMHTLSSGVTARRS
jgi:hypothetical protein